MQLKVVTNIFSSKMSSKMIHNATDITSNKNRCTNIIFYIIYLSSNFDADGNSKYLSPSVKFYHFTVHKNFNSLNKSSVNCTAESSSRLL